MKTAKISAYEYFLCVGYSESSSSKCSLQISSNLASLQENTRAEDMAPILMTQFQPIS